MADTTTVPATTGRRTSLTVDAAMLHALALAALGPAHGPNPRVGCVILAPPALSHAPDAATTDFSERAPQAVLAEGFHRGAGTLHAEAAALADALERGVDVRGATAVVTLEPCNHTGRTGPCAQALIEAGVAEVVFAVGDPNAVAAGGAERLRQHGARVVAGLREAEGERLLGPWLVAVRRGSPYVTLKLAATLDGRVAAADGTSQWITGPEARAHAHGVRAAVDAIAVGTGTALADNPSLTARTTEPGADGDHGPRLADHQPVRVVVGHRDLPTGSHLLDATSGGGEVLHLRTHDVAEVLAELAAREVRHVLVEGGPGLATAFLAAGAVDEVHAYLAPVLLGSGLGVIGDLGVGTLAEAPRLHPTEVRRLGEDVLVVARAAPPPQEPHERQQEPPHYPQQDPQQEQES